MHQEQYLPLTSDSRSLKRRAYLVGKRIMDLSLAVLIMIVVAPLMVFIALLIKLDSRGPVLFTQTRIGQGGRPFSLYKFRTMYQNADPEVHRRYIQSFIHNAISDAPGGNESAATIYKLNNDARITRVGRFLRRTSLDELPQIFNVIKGEMSLVGPRPPLPYEVEEYSEWHKRRLLTIPGMTGLWQVRGRCSVTFDEMVRMDLSYIAQQSLWLDLKILVLTVPAVLSGKGAK